MADPVPLRREAVLAALRALEPELRARGVEALYLFGSVARDEANEASDVDVFCDLNPAKTMGYLSFMGIGEDIEAAIARPVDVMTRRSLHRLVRADVEQAAVQVF